MKRTLILGLSLLLLACSTDNIASVPEVEVAPVATQTPEVEVVPVEKVSVVKFFDYACGHCRNTHFTVKKLKETYGDQIEFELKHYPLSPATYLVAETAECVRNQGLFEAYHNKLFEEYFQNYEVENLQAVAASIGVDMNQFNICVANGGGRSHVQADVNEATSLGVSGTPYFLINNSIPLPGAIPEKSFSRLIQQVLDGEVR